MIRNLSPFFGEKGLGLGMQSTRNRYCLDTSTVADPHTFIKFQEGALLKRGLIMALKEIHTKPLPAGFRWVKCRFRRARAKAGTPDSERRVLDAHEYGYKCWSFPVRVGSKH